MYCYDENGVCPYWALIPDQPEQENGYCHYLERGDKETNENAEITAKERQPDGTYKEVKYPKGGFPIPIGILWDQCKECEINEEDYETCA